MNPYTAKYASYGLLFLVSFMIYFSCDVISLSETRPNCDTAPHVKYNFQPALSPGTHFTNEFSAPIQIGWKFHLALVKLLVIILQQNLTHATTAKLSCHVPNIVAITVLAFGWEQNEISITFELWWKIVSEMGPRPIVRTV